MGEKRAKARRRALRAAKVVSLAAAIAMGPACAQSREGEVVTPPPVADASNPPPTVDSGPPIGEDTGPPPIADGGPLPVDSGPEPFDAGPPWPPTVDSGPPDTGVLVDAGPVCPEPMWNDCCEPMPEECCTFGGWDEVNQCCLTCVAGPLSPPSVPV